MHPINCCRNDGEKKRTEECIAAPQISGVLSDPVQTPPGEKAPSHCPIVSGLSPTFNITRDQKRRTAGERRKPKRGVITSSVHGAPCVRRGVFGSSKCSLGVASQTHTEKRVPVLSHLQKNSLKAPARVRAGRAQTTSSADRDRTRTADQQLARWINRM